MFIASSPYFRGNFGVFADSLPDAFGELLLERYLRTKGTDIESLSPLDRLAYIGNSGMGKSTLINVMQHAYEIQGGKVAFNGKDVRGISRESIRDALTYIDQHPTFWNQKTIKENLLMFNPKPLIVQV